MVLKSILPFGIGVVIGGVAIYGVYKYFKSKDPNNEKLKKEAEFEAKTKIAEERVKRFHELLESKFSVSNLTAKDMSDWFKEYKANFLTSTKMIIAIPTDDVMKGLKYPTTESLDKDKNLLQWFYDDETGKVLKIRLVTFENIESNFQAHLLENNGMLVVTE